MPRSRRKREREPDPAVLSQWKVLDNLREANDTDELATARDYVMARMAAARVCAQNAVDEIDSGLALFVMPEEDASGKKRTECMELALEQLGCATRALECAETSLTDVDNDEEEPWDE
jgi:predicted ATP-grasp superfamily ATP-dependent carboligase